MSRTDVATAVVSDLHTGSMIGLMPRLVVERYGDGEVERKISRPQEQILDAYMDLVDEHGKPDVLVANGDLVDGIQCKQRSAGLVTANLDTQIEMAAELLDMVRARKIIVTGGSVYHRGDNLSADLLVAQKLGAEYGDDYALKLEDQDLRFHFSHFIGVSTSTWQYRSTPIARELVVALLNEAEIGHFDGVIRSHAHYFVEVGFGSQWGVITPCFQLRTPYQVAKGPFNLPKLGYMMIYCNHGKVTREMHMRKLRKPVIKEMTV